MFLIFFIVTDQNNSGEGLANNSIVESGVDSGEQAMPSCLATPLAQSIEPPPAKLPIENNTRESQFAETIPATSDAYSSPTISPVPYVSPKEIRPLPQVHQATATGPRPKSNNKLGRTRILTDTPEKNRIEEEHRKKEEKEMKRMEKGKNVEQNGKKKKLNRELLPEKRKLTKKRKSNEENDKPDEELDAPNLPHVPQVTRTGRVVKKTNRVDL